MARRSVEQILADAEELADQFERGDFGGAVGPGPADELADVASSFQAVAAAERELTRAVLRARQVGHSWAVIGGMMGVTREAVRQRYGRWDPAKVREDASKRRHPTGEAGSRSAVAGWFVEDDTGVRWQVMTGLLASSGEWEVVRSRASEAEDPDRRVG